MSSIQAGCAQTFIALSLTLAVPDITSAQTNAGNAAVDLGVHGGITAAAPTQRAQDPSGSPVEYSFSTGVATDYIYRGTTLSAHRPVFGTAFEAAFGMFYGMGTVATVNLPSQPVAEISTGGGIRPKLGDVQFDFGATYFSYPGETPPIGVQAGINYWEALARADTKLTERLGIAGGFAYSPSVSNTGAWSKYAAFGVGYDLPSNLLPNDIAASLKAGAGYSWFGNQSAALGGFPLPAYVNWNAGMTFTKSNLNLDLRYYDTNLSKENCFVFTGDPGAAPGGRPDLITNPEGLVSRWCSATFVAKFWFSLN